MISSINAKGVNYTAMMSSDTFSVSMCVYGGDNPVFFDVALQSVINQTVKPYEIVLVVDGPIPDEIESVIEKYRIYLSEISICFHVIYLEKNMGHGEARRIGFENCCCSLIALMDADDISLPYRFEKQLHVFKNNPEISIVGGIIQEFIDTPNNPVAKRVVPENDVDIKQYMKKRCPMNQMTVMFRKEAVQEAGGYLDWYCDEDYYLWIRLALADKKFANLSDILVDVRVGADMYQRRGGWKYYKSEKTLQKLMLDKRMIGVFRYFINVSERFILQVLMPNWLRGFVFRKLARE